MRKPYRTHITALNAAASLRAVARYQPSLGTGTVDLEGWASTTAGSECHTPSETGTILAGSDVDHNELYGDQLNIPVTRERMDEVLAAVLRVEVLVREEHERTSATMNIDQETLSTMLREHESSLFTKIAEDGNDNVQRLSISHETEFGRLRGNQAKLDENLGKTEARIMKCFQKLQER